MALTPLLHTEVLLGVLKRSLMLNRSFCILVVALFCFAASAAFGHPSSVRAQLLATYARMDLGISKYNPKQFIELIKDITAPGKMRDSMLQGAEETAKAGGDPDMVRVNQVKTKIISLAVHRDKATAVVEQYADVVRRDSQGEFGPVGKIHHMVGTQVLKDTWVKIGANWKLADEADVSETGTIDGKPEPTNIK